jgi:F0F1-type ATP synthase delta subunit
MITTEDRNQLVAKLQTIKESLYTTKDLGDLMDTLLTEEESKFVGKGDQTSLEKKILELESLPVVSLTLAQNPTISSLKHIHEWLKNTLKKQVLIIYKIDQNMTAGAKIEYNGLYKDYSIS